MTRGVRVVKTGLNHRWGLYDDDHRTIYLNSSLTSWQELSTLAHELSHAHHRDRPTSNRRLHQAREHRADVEAAMTLINPLDYARAERYATDAGAIAAELGVSVWVVEAFAREADAGREWTQLPVGRPTVGTDFDRIWPRRNDIRFSRKSA